RHPAAGRAAAFPAEPTPSNRRTCPAAPGCRSIPREHVRRRATSEGHGRDHRVTVRIDGDRAGATVLDKDYPVGTVPVLLCELLVLRSGQPRNGGGEQPGQVLHTFDEVAAESLIDFREF